MLLQARGYYTKGFRDGLDGPLTQEAVAQARKDNGMGDGGADAPFLAALPSFPRRPVSIERASLTVREAAAARPDLFGPVKLLGMAGAVLGVGGAADGSGVLDQVKAAASNVGEAAGTVQAVLGPVLRAVAFLAEHPALVLVGVGLFLLFKAANLALDFAAKVRAAFL